jgi:hypothetical protein
MLLLPALQLPCLAALVLLLVLPECWVLFLQVLAGL